MFDWSGFYVGLGIFVILAILTTGMKKPVAAWMEYVEWFSCGKNKSMY